MRIFERTPSGESVMEAQLLPVEDSIDSFTNAESERRKQLVGGSNSRAVLATCVTCLGPFLFGYSLGFTSPVLTAMKVSQSDSVFSSGLTEVDGAVGLPSPQATLFSATVTLGAMAGSLLGGAACDALGRRTTLALAGVPLAGAWAWTALAQDYRELLAARFVVGLMVGVLSMAAPLYINEIAPTRLRGTLGGANQVAVTVGILAAYALGALSAALRGSGKKSPTLVACGEEEEEEEEDGGSGSGSGSSDWLALHGDLLHGARCGDVVHGWECLEVGGGVDGGDGRHFVCAGALPDWRLLCWAACGAAALLATAAPLLLPEAPPYLHARGRVDACRAALLWLRGGGAAGARAADAEVAALERLADADAAALKAEEEEEAEQVEAEEQGEEQERAELVGEGATAAAESGGGYRPPLHAPPAVPGHVLDGEVRAAERDQGHGPEQGPGSPPDSSKCPDSPGSAARGATRGAAAVGGARDGSGSEGGGALPPPAGSGVAGSNGGGGGGGGGGGSSSSSQGRRRQHRMRPRPRCCAARGRLRLCGPHHRRALAVAVAAMALQQLSGINAVIFYSGPILEASGMRNAALGAMGLAGCQVAATGAGAAFMDRAGRRSLLGASAAGMAASAMALAAAFALHGRAPPWLALAGLVGYVTAFSVGVGPVPWLVMGELFPPHVRAQACALAAATNWAASFLVTYSFDPLVAALGPARVFAAFAATCASTVLFAATVMPETRGRTLEEIARELRATSISTSGTGKDGPSSASIGF